MVLRVLGLKEEETYGSLKTGVTRPDFHRRLEDGSFKLGDEPTTSNDGSRMIQMTRPGVIKPTGSSSGKCDLKRIGHYLKAFFDNYSHTSTSTTHTHKFWGGEGQDLTSFHGWATYDYFQKVISGLLLDSFSLEVTDEYIKQSEGWIYKEETWESITPSTYHIYEVDGEIPLMFYDINLKLNDTTMSDVIFTSCSVEGKNNLNQDGTIGLGSRKPQRKAQAQNREINLEVKSYMSNGSNFLGLLKGAEYGTTTSTSPDSCNIYKIPVEVDIGTCSAESTDTLKMYFPQCTVKVEYSASESDEIEVTFTLLALGTGKLTNFSEFSTDPLEGKATDCYCVLVNDVGEINDEAQSSSSE